MLNFRTFIFWLVARTLGINLHVVQDETIRNVFNDFVNCHINVVLILFFNDILKPDHIALVILFQEMNVNKFVHEPTHYKSWWLQIYEPFYSYLSLNTTTYLSHQETLGSYWGVGATGSLYSDSSTCAAFLETCRMFHRRASGLAGLQNARQ